MKYASLDIEISKTSSSDNGGPVDQISLFAHKVHRETVHVEYKNKFSDGSGFNIKTFYSVTRMNIGFLRFGLLLPETMPEDRMLTCLHDSSINRARIILNPLPEYYTQRGDVSFVCGKILETLYLWDKRCSRSVNVKPKIDKDVPIKLTMYGEAIFLDLKGMKSFSDFLLNKA